MIKHQDIKQRFGIIGNSNKLDRAISTALQIAPTDISVLITGESGVGKEAMPKIIHYNSQRKHNKYNQFYWSRWTTAQAVITIDRFGP